MKETMMLFVVNAKEFLRDRLAVVLVLLLPVAFAGFFGLIFSGSGQGGFQLPLGVVNEDSGPAGELLVLALQAPELLETITIQTGTRAEMRAALESREVSLVLILPADMTELVGAGRQAAVGVVYDVARPESAGTGLSLVQNLLAEANLALSGAPSLLVMEASSVQTESLRPIDTQMPGMLGIALLWLGLFGTALPLVQQRSSQVLRRLSVTPLRPVSMLSAHVSWRVVVGLVQAGVFLLVGYFAFQVGVQGNMLLFLAAVVLGSLVFVSLGYVLAGLISSEEGVLGATQLVNFPMMFLCGGLFAISSLPEFLQPVSKLLPLTYLTDALGQLMVGAPPLHPLWLDFAVLFACLAVFLVVGVKFWKWE